MPACAPAQTRVDAAVASLVTPHVPAGWTVVARASSQVEGMTDVAAKTITLSVASCAVEPQPLLAHVVEHEFGHVWDLEHPAQRAGWLAARGLPASTPWFTCSGCSDFGVGVGDFVESYATWQAGPGYFKGTLRPQPTPAELAQMMPYLQ